MSTATDSLSLTDRLEVMQHAAAAAPATYAQRMEQLRALERLVLDNRAAIAAAISQDFGHRAVEETALLEVFPSVSGLRYARRQLRRWMRPTRRWAGRWFLPARTELRPQPLGVVGIIVPWNYPLNLAVGPLTDALAAGNRVMLKLSEYTPAFSALFAALIARYFDEDVVTVVTGDATVAQAFSALPFDHLLFTGSTAVGRAVMAAAAPNLTPVTLELGGKSPALITPGARLEHAVERILAGKLLNAGQTCIAPDYVLLPRGDVAAFIALAKATTLRLYPDMANNAQFSHIAQDRQFARLQGLLQDALDRGARLHPLAEGTASGRCLLPVVLTEVDDTMAVMQEEIFGPILPVLAYEGIDEAVRYINAHPRPLAMYLFDADRTRIDRVLQATHAGGVTVNDTLLHIAQHHLPFGGIGASGMGAYHGEAGFRTFSHYKPVFRQARWNGVGLLSPPYGARFRRMLRLLLGA